MQGFPQLLSLNVCKSEINGGCAAAGFTEGAEAPLLNIKLVKTLKSSATRGRQRLYIMTPDGENMAIDR